jgi:hypothetical protein
MTPEKRIVEPEETAIAMQLPVNNMWQLVSMATDMHAVRKELLETVFSSGSMPRLYKKNELELSVSLRHLPRRPRVHLTHLFNHCLWLSHFPKSWKEAKIITLLKPGKDPKFSHNISIYPNDCCSTVNWQLPMHVGTGDIYKLSQGQPFW